MAVTTPLRPALCLLVMALASTAALVGAACITAAATVSCRGDTGRPTPVTRGLVIPTMGAAGVTLGMSRAEVIRCLGSPLRSNNRYGFLSYGSIFDINLDHGRVAYMNISGEGFCLPHRICMWDSNNLRLLKKYYGSQLYVVRQETGEQALVMYGTFKGRRTKATLFLHGANGSFNEIEIAWRQ
jgi:hypothetical protein